MQLEEVNNEKNAIKAEYSHSSKISLQKEVNLEHKLLLNRKELRTLRREHEIALDELGRTRKEVSRRATPEETIQRQNEILELKMKIKSLNNRMKLWTATSTMQVEYFKIF